MDFIVTDSLKINDIIDPAYRGFDKFIWIFAVASNKDTLEHRVFRDGSRPHFLPLASPLIYIASFRDKISKISEKTIYLPASSL